MKLKPEKRYPYAIVYRGAPYGDDEWGHITSQHTSLRTATKRYRKESTNYSGEDTTFPLNHVIVRLKDSRVCQLDPTFLS